MASVDATGFTPRDLAGYRSLLEERFRGAFGADLSVDPETPQGQIIGIVALGLAESDEALAALANAHSVWTAAGIQLDDQGSLLGVSREPATHSLVGLTVSGVAGVTVPAGSRVRTADDLTTWVTLVDVVLAPAGVAVAAIALEPGAVAAEAATITRIVTAVPGWETVTNPAAAVAGLPAQQDEPYRALYRLRTARLALTPADAVVAALVEAQAVRTAVYENTADDPAEEKSLQVAGHSILAVADGGEDAALSAAVLAGKTVGAGVMTSALATTDAVLADLQAVNAGSLSFGATRTIDAIDLSAATTLAEAVAALNTRIQAVSGMESVTAILDGARFGLVYPFHPSWMLDPASGSAGVLGFAAGSASGLPFLRPRESALTVVVNVTRDLDTFPADGLARLRAAADVVGSGYSIGQDARVNDFIRALESVAGAKLTSIAVTSARGSLTDTPADVRHVLPAANLTLNVT